MSVALAVSLGPELARVQHRLALGVQCVEALTGRPLLAPLRLTLLRLGPLEAGLELQPKGGGRYSLVDTGRFAVLWNRCTEPGRTLPRGVDLLAHEGPPRVPLRESEQPHQHGPRRVAMTLAETVPPAPDPLFRPRPLPGRDNLLTLRLFPGPNYPHAGGGTLLRGRVRLGTNEADAKPARWARLVAMKGASLLGCTQADERGEFALLLRYPAGLLAPATPHASDGQIDLHVAARRTPPAHVTAFDDLSPEPAAVVAADANPLAELPASYDRRVAVQRTLVFGRTHSGADFDFLLAP